MAAGSRGIPRLKGGRIHVRQMCRERQEKIDYQKSSLYMTKELYPNPREDVEGAQGQNIN